MSSKNWQKKSQSNEMEGTFNCHFCFTFKFLKPWGPTYWFFFDSHNSMKWKGRCFGFAFNPKVELSALTTVFESRNSRKMKMTFNCHFGFTFKMQRCDLFWQSQFKETENDFQLSFLLWFHSKSLLFFIITFLKVSIQGKWKGLSTVIWDFDFTAKVDCLL